MKRIISFITMALLLCKVVNAQAYPVASIPDSLMQNAHSVTREYMRQLEVLTINTGIEITKKIITVLDKNGDGDAVLRIGYDKDTKVSIKQINLFDKNGKKIRKIKLSEIKDFPAYDGVSMYSDNRIKYYKSDYAGYPYSMEYEYEIKRNNLISYGRWFPIQGYNTSVEKSKFVFIRPSSIQVSKKELNINSASLIEKKTEKIIETWECNNFTAIEAEPFDVSLSERLPNVMLMPLEFKYDNYSGTVTNWTDYGKWIKTLYEGRDVLVENEKIKVSELLKDVPDTLQRIKLLYEYMQGRTRYVGIQLGIGGFQPFTAQSVYETGYGDCKALSNYMYSLLKQAGIKSFSALVSSGRYIESIYKDFPNFSQYDHVILSVPLKTDTLWLECTSQTMPFGFIGDFTDDREVLLLTDEGGQFAHTKKYTADENLRVCNANFIIDAQGSVNCRLITQYQGLQYDAITGLLNMNSDEQKKWLYKNSSLPSLSLNKFTITNKNQRLPIASIDEESTSANYCSTTGQYMIVPLNKINSQSPIQKMLKDRKSDFIINRSTTDYDTLIFQIPQNYVIEHLPAGKTLNSEFGNYTYKAELQGKQLIYTRKFINKQGRYKAADYKNFYEYIVSVSTADSEKAMLRKVSE